MPLVELLHDYYSALFGHKYSHDMSYNSDKYVLDLLSYMYQLYTHIGLPESQNFGIAVNMLHASCTLSLKQIILYEPHQSPDEAAEMLPTLYIQHGHIIGVLVMILQINN